METNTNKTLTAFLRIFYKVYIPSRPCQTSLASDWLDKCDLKPN